MSATSKLDLRMLEGAKNYAAADRSDPFAFARAIAHIKNGVASINNANQNAGYYNAEPYKGKREIVQNGVVIGEVDTILYRTIVRP